MELSSPSETAPVQNKATILASSQPRTGVLRPQNVTRLLLLAAVLGVCQQSYSHYRDIDHYFAGYWIPFVHGTGAAPEQYRVGVKMLAWWLVKHLSWGFRHGFMLMDIVGSTTGVLLVYTLLQRRPVIRSASPAVQWFASAGFVLLVCYYMMWVSFFVRPETLPSLGLTACMAWLWMGQRRERSNTAVTICGLLAAAAIQAWIRADIACALNAGMFFVALMGSGDGLSISKRAALVTSAACVMVAGGTQLYIMRVLYPHASYGNIPIFMGTRDLRRPLTFPPFLIFMLPLVWTGVQAWRKRAALDTGSRGLLLGAAIYLVLWIAMGKLDEVRIFIPFAVVLIPITIDLAIRRISFDTQLNGRGVEV